ncbi:hypothetical protein [Planomonospora sp. ID82291]|uniref:hypothetical protein n=1 Tax=Planomonospora sp. ID82291 TaxID=2738136 RepID=UPI0018C412A5|nr:hypothetical protein [Planomonospora sp. ID82291]MBG0818950.1 hypothetical protein [Planomonospora sp. ID82291]
MDKPRHRSTPWRRDAMGLIFPAEARAGVLSAVAGGETVSEAMERYGLPHEIAFGRARWDTEWRDQLYRALMDGRDPSLEHGRARTYRGGCRCPECMATQSGCTAAQRFLQTAG